MSVEERIITIQFLKKIEENPHIAKELGIEVVYDVEANKMNEQGEMSLWKY